MGLVWATLPVQAQLGGLGLGSPLGGTVNNLPMNGGQQRSTIGNSRLQISNGISNGTIGLIPNPNSPNTTNTPGIGTTIPTMSTFGNPGGGPGGGGVGSGGYDAAPIDGGAIILIILGLGIFLQIRLREYKKNTHASQ